MILYIDCTEFLLYVKQMIQKCDGSLVIRPLSLAPLHLCACVPVLKITGDRFGQKILDRANW